MFFHVGKKKKNKFKKNVSGEVNGLQNDIAENRNIHNLTNENEEMNDSGQISDIGSCSKILFAIAIISEK